MFVTVLSINTVSENESCLHKCYSLIVSYKIYYVLLCNQHMNHIELRKITGLTTIFIIKYLVHKYA